MFTVDVKTKAKNPNAMRDLKKRLKEMSSKKIAVGFPKGRLNNPHYEDGASIIDVAIWNEFGTNNIPRRDFMGIATEKWQQFIAAKVEEFKEQISDGTLDIDMFLKMIGEAGKEFISDAIVKLRTPPNAPSTIRHKKGRSNPLVDSGDMSKAATYEIRKVEQ